MLLSGEYALPMFRIRESWRLNFGIFSREFGIIILELKSFHGVERSDC